MKKKEEKTIRGITPYINAAEHKPAPGKFAHLDTKAKEVAEALRANTPEPETEPVPEPTAWRPKILEHLHTPENIKWVKSQNVLMSALRMFHGTITDINGGKL